MREKISILVFVFLVFTMSGSIAGSQGNNYDDFVSLLKATTVTIHLDSVCEAFTVAYDKASGFVYGTETGCGFGVPVLGVFPVDVPKQGGKALVLSVSDYGGSPTKRWLYIFNWATGMAVIYSYDGIGSPHNGIIVGWYYTYDIGSNSSSGSLRNTQEMD